MADFLSSTLKGAGDIVGGAGKLAGGVFSHLGTGLKSVRDEARAKMARPGLVNRQLKLERLRQEIELAGGETSPAGEALLLKYYRENAPEIMEMMKGGQPFMPAQTPLQEAQTESYESLSDWRKKMAGEVGKEAPKKPTSLFDFVGKIQTIHEKYRDKDLTENSARAQMSLLARKSDPEFSKLSGIFDLPEQKKEKKESPYTKPSGLFEFVEPDERKAAARKKLGLDKEKTKRQKWLDEGLTEAEAAKAIRIEAELEAGATSAKDKDVLRRIKDWSAIRKGAMDTFGDVFDQPTYDTATKRIYKLQQQALAEQKGIVTERTAPSATDYKPATPSEGLIMSQISKMKVGDRIIGPKQAGEIVKAYPSLSKLLVKMSPAERKEILGAIADGMTEAEILRFIGE